MCVIERERKRGRENGKEREGVVYYGSRELMY